MQEEHNTSSVHIKKGFSGLQVFGITFLTIIVTLLLTLIAVKVYFFPSLFTPVVLSGKEQQQFEQKISFLERIGMTDTRSDDSLPANDVDDKITKQQNYEADGKVIPQAYSEKVEDRIIIFNERELNALLAKNTDLATMLAFNLSRSVISARLLIPVDPDFPVMGGKIIRVRAGVELGYKTDKPVVKLKGVSLMGVPIPNAWMGGLKNIDLVSEFGNDPGFWKTFAEGLKSVEVQEGQLKIILNE